MQFSNVRAILLGLWLQSKASNSLDILRVITPLTSTQLAPFRMPSSFQISKPKPLTFGQSNYLDGMTWRKFANLYRLYPMSNTLTWERSWVPWLGGMATPKGEVLAAIQDCRRVTSLSGLTSFRPCLNYRPYMASSSFTKFLQPPLIHGYPLVMLLLQHSQWLVPILPGNRTQRKCR